MTQRILLARQTIDAHRNARAALEVANTAAGATAGLEELAHLQRLAAQHARDVGEHVVTLGRPSPLAHLLDELLEDAGQLSRSLDLVAATLDQMRLRVLAGSWPVTEVTDVLHAQARLGDLYLEHLGVLLDRLAGFDEQARRYFDGVFASVETSPAWSEALRTCLEPDGKPRGVRFAELPDDD